MKTILITLSITFALASCTLHKQNESLTTGNSIKHINFDYQNSFTYNNISK